MSIARVSWGLMLGWVAMTFHLRVLHGGSSTLKRLSKKKGLEVTSVTGSPTNR